MRLLKRSTRPRPRVSLILLDWGVRESFHLLHYLQNQSVSREDFEVILIEYYDRVSPAAEAFEPQIDTWILLQMLADCYYHKHVMYNAGIVFSKGGVLMFGDSDAMARPTFVETILQAFERDPLIVYHLDEFRSARRDFYLFNYPSFEDVLGDGCINNIGGKTKGVLDEIDPIHTRNYGACMCARREDIIAIGGADEDLTYLGHICGPYDMTFRLMNSGRRVVWETEEYLYHTWHPGSDGVDNYLGPHDGRNMSTTALQALCSGRIPPLVENAAIRSLRTGLPTGEVGAPLLERLIDPRYIASFSRTTLGRADRQPAAHYGSRAPLFASYGGFDVYRLDQWFYAVPAQMGAIDWQSTEWREDQRVIQSRSFTEIREALDACEARFLETVGLCNICAVGKRFAVVPQGLGTVDFRIRSQREDPGILWTESLIEARRKAQECTAVAPHRERPLAGTAAPASRRELFGAAHWKEELANLERRTASLEAAVAGIYDSRTWRTLVRAGGLLQKAARLVRPPRKNQSE
jgi:hypothetical protein